MTTICIFAGWQPGEDPIYLRQARTLGRLLAERQIHVVFGGTLGGLMGAVAEAVLDEGGQVTGVVPDGLWEVLHFTKATRLERVASLEERVERMAHLADGFAVLPGGVGTLHELFAILDHAQVLGHDKPIGLLNTRGYFTPLLTCLDLMQSLGFVLPSMRRRLWCEDTPEQVVRRLLEACGNPFVLEKGHWL